MPLFSAFCLVLLASSVCLCYEPELITSMKMHNDDQGYPLQSRSQAEERFNSSKREFERRWEKFKEGKIFSPWYPDKKVDLYLKEKGVL